MRTLNVLVCSLILYGCGSSSPQVAGPSGTGGAAGSNPVGVGGAAGFPASGGAAGSPTASGGSSAGGGTGGAAAGGVGGTASGGAAGAPGGGGTSGSGGSAPAGGTLDPSYGSAGVQLGAALAGFGKLEQIGEVVALPSGGALYGGTKAGASYSDFNLTTTNADGSMAKTKTDDIGNHYDASYGLARYPDGRVVLAGIANNGLVDRFGVLRYTAGLALDTTFDGDGKVMTGFGSYNQAFAVALDGSRVVVAGAADDVLTQRDFALAVYGNGGALDSGFDSDGIATMSLGGDDVARAVRVDAGGRYVVAGVVGLPNGTSDLGVARFNANGTPDLGFGQGGHVVVNVGAKDDVAPGGIDVAQDGSLTLAGTAGTNNNPDFFLCRLTPNGALDTSFSADGCATVDVGLADHAFGFAPVAAGGWAVVGTSTGNDLVVVRVDPSGAPSSGFGQGGVAKLDRGMPASAYTVVEEPGRLLVIGAELDGSTVRAVSAKLFE